MMEAHIHIKKNQGKNAHLYVVEVVYPLSSSIITRDYHGHNLAELMKQLTEENNTIFERPYVVHISRID